MMQFLQIDKNYTIAEIMGITQIVVGFGADGTSVNMGIRKGIVVRLQDKHLWLLPIQSQSCSFYNTLTLLHYFYHASGKEQSEVHELASRNLDTLMFSHRSTQKMDLNI